MTEITINIKSDSAVDTVVLKQALQSIASNFSKENILAIAKVSKANNVNENLPKLLGNPMVKMYL